LWNADADGAAFVTLHVELSTTEAHARNETRATADQVRHLHTRRCAPSVTLQQCPTRCSSWNKGSWAGVQVPEAVIERMASRLEPPNAAEFPWERAATVRSDREDNLQSVWESVRSLWGTAPPTAPTAEELAEKV
jgi:tRNA uridine 5-carbamoylmethylation protein Kti12